MTRRSHHIDHRGNTNDRRRRRALVRAVYGTRGLVPCFWCGVKLRTKFTIDRLDPVGLYHWENIVPACEKCNKGRRRKPISETIPAEYFPG